MSENNSVLGSNPPVPHIVTSDELAAENIKYDAEKTYSDGTVGKEITELKSDITDKLDANLGATEAGKFLKIDTDGSIIPTNLPLYQGGVE